MRLEPYLRRHPLLALLTAEQMTQWLGSASEATFQAGETIFRQGTPGAWAYLVRDGKVRAVRTTAADRDLTLGTMGPGEVFGEYALIRPGLNTATCRAAAVSRLLRLPLASLARHLESRPEVAANLKNWLRLHALIQHLRWQSFLGFLSAPSALKHLACLESMTVPARCTIQANGLSDERWYFLEKGQVRLQEAGEETARELGPGEWFGEQALLVQGTVPTAVALTEVECRTLTRAAFLGQTAPRQPDSHLQTFRQPSGPAQRFEWVGQQQQADCGLAALAMIARYHGLAVTVEQLREKSCAGERGVSLMQLEKLSRAVGLSCTAVCVGPQQWNQLRLPAIVHLKQGHFVVLFQLEMAGVQVGDPATGLLTQTLASFRERCSGKALVFTAPKQLPANPYIPVGEGAAPEW